MKLFLFLSMATLFLFASVSCKDFNTQQEAQRYFDAKKPGYKRLDGDRDGEACECLKGGSGYYKAVCKRWRKKYGKQ